MEEIKWIINKLARCSDSLCDVGTFSIVATGWFNAGIVIEFAVLAIIGSLAVADVLLIGLDAGAKVVAGPLKTGLRGRRGGVFYGGW